MSHSRSAASTATLVHRLGELAELEARACTHERSAHGFRFLADGSQETAHWSFSELNGRALTCAALLWASNLKQGDRCVLLFQPSLDFIAAFFGCLYAGVVAVPAYPPRRGPGLQRLMAIITDAGARAVLCDGSIAKRAQLWRQHHHALKGITWLDMADAPQQAPLLDPNRIASNQVAFLQYTSGSTAMPKGVVIRHQQLQDNLNAIQRAFDQGRDTTVVGWLPFYHDMGLIGNLLQTVHVGSHCVLMPPMAFLRNPRVWLQAIQRYQATTSGGPNFAYDLCVRKIPQAERAKLNLTSWRHAFNGAEPIRAATLQRFEAAFAASGFSPQAWFPCYGLAEHTLFVCGGPPRGGPPRGGSPLRNGANHEGITRLHLDANALQEHRVRKTNRKDRRQTLVTSGAIPENQIVQIVDPAQRCPVERGTIGEIWLRGPGKADAYWQKPTQSQRDFQAVLVDDPQQGHFLRTGDLGFVHKGELVVTGRLKDMIIIRGRNYYPQDLELASEGLHPILKAGRSAAFSFERDAGKAVVLVSEVARRHPRTEDLIEAATAIHTVISETFDLPLHDLIFIGPGQLPRTSSGKVRRFACRQKYIDGGFDRLNPSPKDESQQSCEPTSKTPTLTGTGLLSMPHQARQAKLATYLTHTLARLLRMDTAQVVWNRPLTTMGLDSLAAVDFHDCVERDLGTAPSVQQLLEGADLETISHEIMVRLNEPAPRLELPKTRGNDHPLSPGQQALWFMQAMAPDTTAFILAGMARADGQLNVTTLAAALQTVVERHASLRTTFHHGENTPTMQVHDHLLADIHVVDARNKTTARTEALAEAFMLKPFDLTNGPLIRLMVVREKDQQWLLALSLHHLITDFWSIGLLLSEMETIYRATLAHRQPPLPPVHHGFADAVAATADWLKSDSGEAQWHWWRNQLSDKPMQLTLPTDYPRPKRWSGRGGYTSTTLNSELRTRIDQMAAQYRTTRYTVLLTIFAACLSRWSGQTECLIGTPTTGRAHQQLDRIMGYFINPVVIAADTRGQPCFTDFLLRMRQTVWDALRHRELPFPVLAERLQPQRQAGQTPVFQVFFVMEQAKFFHERGLSAFALADSPASLDLFDLRWQARPIQRRDAQFDLMMLVSPLPNGLALSLEYNADLFSSTTASNLLDSYVAFLEAAVATPNQSLHRLPLHSQRPQTLWQDETPNTPSVLQSFAAQVQQRPNEIAVIHDVDEWTYTDLATKATAFAHHLRSVGVSQETAVALCLPRGLALFAAILGTMAAGGCYVPLDPAYPDARLQDLLADVMDGTPTAHLIAYSAEARRFDNFANLNIINPDQVQNQGEGQPSLAPPALDQNAYIIYTSGSTGRPKGVQVTHRNLSALMYVSKQFAFTADDVWTLFHAYAFDFSVWEMWGALYHGGTVVVVPWETSRDPQRFAHLLRTEAVTVLNQTPSAFRALLPFLLEKACTSLRWIIFGGEALDPHIVQRWFEQSHPGPRVVNMYGITETTIHVTAHELLPEDAHYQTTPLGEPLPHLALTLVDPMGESRPHGLPGEIAVSGAGVAKGYLHRPSLTASRFVPNPFCDADHPGDRLYLSGDVARRNHAGHLVFTGRADHQIKLRGFRIEPGEIEACLLSCPPVNDAVVRCRLDDSGQPALLAWTTGHASQGDLRAFCQSHLPSHMIPDHFIALDAIPITANGKLDVTALPAPQRQGSATGNTPQTITEQRLAQLWCDLLRVDQIGRDDNFFELGGHSLLATRLSAQMREYFGYAPPISHIFEKPTLRDLAASLPQQLAQPEPEGLPASIQPAPAAAHEPFPLTEIQQAYWIGRRGGFELGNIATHVYFEIDAQALDLARLNRAWCVLVQRHPMLRTIFTDEGMQQVLPQVPDYHIAISDMRDVSTALCAQHLQQVREALSHQVLATNRFPIFTITASLHGRNQTRLHISFDALIADAWSMLLLFREWSQLYNEPATELPPLTLTFRDYVLAEKKLLHSAAYQQDWAYWQARLDQIPPAPELPLAIDPSQIESPRFVRHEATLPAGLWRALQAKTAAAGTSPSSVLLTAFADVLARWSKSPRFTMNLTLFNRLPLHPQVHDLVGDFTTLNLLAVDQRKPLPFQERVARLQGQLWRDLDHRHVSGLRILRELGRRGGDHTRARMPVVFTSALGMEAMNAEHLGHFGRLGYGISQTPQVWLDHVVVARDGMLAFNWDVVDGLFPQGMIAAMFAAYRSHLAYLASDDQAWKSTAPIPLPAEQQAVRNAVNQTESAWPLQPLHEGFFAQARRQPKAPAVLTSESQISYETLAQQAHQVAQSLRQQGLQPGELVAIALPKRAAQIAAVLGTLAAGGVYLPMTPDMPPARRQAIFDTSQTRTGITDGQHISDLQQHAHISWLAIDDAFQQDLATPHPLLMDVDHLAYVIFTSGSTGIPKGVVIDHRAAANTIADINHRLDVTAEDRVLCLSSLSFDLSVYDIFGLLAVGGAIVLPEEVRDPANWQYCMQEHRVTIWNTVPALMQMLDAHVAHSDYHNPHLRLVMLSGDWIPVDLPSRLRRWSAPQIISLGGATEAAIWSILYPIDQVKADWESIPYGKPMANQQFYVLDQQMHPCPDWVHGELYIGGMGLAKGYLDDPAKTATSFTHHPFDGRRLYRTGDWGYREPDGTIRFLGREDQQVKVGGYRIELGEIGTALLEHPSVAAATAVVVGDPKGSRQLAAFAVCHSRDQTEQPSIPPGASLTDPVARATFKLRRPGRPQWPVDNKHIALADHRDSQLDFRRQSYRRFAKRPLDLVALGNWLSCLRAQSVADAPLPKYGYPSAGSLNPVQTYLYLKPASFQEKNGGFYGYDPEHHHLVPISDTSLDRDIYGTAHAPLFDTAAFAIFLIANLDAIVPMYGDLARDFCLLEAGYMGQLLMTEAPNQQLGLCPIGYVPTDPLRGALGLSANQQLIHSFLAGPITASQTRQWQQNASMADPKQALLDHLQQRLPSYMIPQQIHLLESMPLTANGKVDRKALATQITRSAPVSPDNQREQPTTALEQQLADWWAQILDQTAVGRHQNFFELGGDSLELVQIHRRIQASDLPGAQSLSVVDLFRHPTLAQMARYIEGFTTTSTQGATAPSNDSTQRAVTEAATRAQRQRAALRRQAQQRTNHQRGGDLS